jgi:hypothetical protein
MSICFLLTIQKSAAIMAEIGARKTASEAIKVNREDAEEMIFHGTITQPPIMVVSMAPR